MFRPCPSCGHAHAQLLTRFTTSEWPVVRCDGCSFVFLGRVPDYAALAHDLAWETTSKAEAKRRSAHFIYRLDGQLYTCVTQGCCESDSCESN